MESKSSFKKPKQVLVFNGARILIAMARSLHCLSELTGANLQSISFACTGLYVSANGLYFRHLHPDVLVDASDLNVLKLQEYDKLCGEEDRRYHSVREMARRKKQHEQRIAKKQNNDKE